MVSSNTKYHSLARFQSGRNFLWMRDNSLVLISIHQFTAVVHATEIVKHAMHGRVLCLGAWLDLSVFWSHAL